MLVEIHELGVGLETFPVVSHRIEIQFAFSWRNICVDFRATILDEKKKKTRKEKHTNLTWFNKLHIFVGI